MDTPPDASDDEIFDDEIFDVDRDIILGKLTKDDNNNSHDIMLETIKNGDLDTLRKLGRLPALITSDCNMDTDDEYRAFILAACRYGHVKILEYLLIYYEEYEIHIATVHKMNEIAIENDHINILQFISSTFRFNLVDHIGRYFKIACRYGQIKILQHFSLSDIVEYLRNYSYSTLICTAKYGQIHILRYLVQILLQNNMEVEIQESFRHAVEETHLNVLQYLCSIPEFTHTDNKYRNLIKNAIRYRTTYGCSQKSMEMLVFLKNEQNIDCDIRYKKDLCVDKILLKQLQNQLSSLVAHKVYCYIHNTFITAHQPAFEKIVYNLLIHPDYRKTRPIQD